MLNEPNAYELQPISHSVPASPAEKEDEDGDYARSTRRLSFDSVQSYELYTPDEDRRVLRKLDRKLVGFMALLYCLSFLDRTNIGNARIAGMQRDLQLSSKQFEWLIWAFYITYIGFEWMTLMYRIVPPHIYISICIFSWGLIACLQSIAPTFSVLVALRALLGIGEAAFSPGVPFYLSFFFRRRELAFRTGLFISASPLSSAFAGALAWLITKLASHTPLSPWRLLFLLEGFPSMLVAVWAFSFVPDGPGSVRWLTARERKVAVLRLRQEKEGAHDDDEEEEEEEEETPPSRPPALNPSEILHTLLDPKPHLTALMLFSANVAFGSTPIFLPTILHSTAHSALTAQALTLPPYLLAFLSVLATAHLSDRAQSRSPFIIAHALLAAGGYGAIALLGHYRSPHTLLRYFALFPAVSGFFSCVTLIITWTLNNQRDATARGAGIALLNLVGQFGPLVGAGLFPEEQGPWYVEGMAVCAGFMGAVAVLAGVLRAVLARENARASASASARGEYAGLDGGNGRRERGKPFEYML
ncbi:hypothetical protein G6514_002121 [Epicoccum nigrum]|nr:hypothetical protein G6514_002121 [Epicoccum nigrum]